KVSRITGSSSAPDRGNVWLGNPIQIHLHEVAHVDLIIHQTKKAKSLRERRVSVNSFLRR
ncbi:MAG: hypothetical protein RR475_08565, partial [Clostridia bacterium]